MGGDLKEGSPKLSSPLHQRFWFEEFAKVGKEVEFDSLSTHIYWNYDATKRFHDRLDNVRHDLNRLTGNLNDRDSPTLKYPVPIYVTEFGTRSPDFASPGVIDPGNFHGEQGKVPMYKTTIAPFQAAWFQIVAAQMGYAGMLKWDCQFGIYDNNNKVREYHAVGRPDPGQPTAWQVWPMYSPAAAVHDDDRTRREGAPGRAGHGRAGRGHEAPGRAEGWHRPDDLRPRRPRAHR